MDCQPSPRPIHALIQFLAINIYLEGTSSGSQLMVQQLNGADIWIVRFLGKGKKRRAGGLGGEEREKEEGEEVSSYCSSRGWW